MKRPKELFVANCPNCGVRREFLMSMQSWTARGKKVGRCECGWSGRARELIVGGRKRPSKGTFANARAGQVAMMNTSDTVYSPPPKPLLDAKTFYASREWQTVRYGALKKADGCCTLCGRSKRQHNVVLHVDHIKPRSLYPMLELDPSNLQVLCEDCNIGKSNKCDRDWRDLTDEEVIAENVIVFNARERGL